MAGQTCLADSYATIHSFDLATSRISPKPRNLLQSRAPSTNYSTEMQRVRPAQRPAADGSRTITIHDSAPRELHPADPDIGDAPENTEVGGDSGRDRVVQPTLVLNLHGGGNDVRRKRKAGQRVVWKEDVVDNEGCGKKKSKICCIYHKPRRFDESSDESSDSDCEDHSHPHSHGGSNGPDSADTAGPSSSNVATSSASATLVTSITSLHAELNAYDTQPRPRPVPTE